MIFPSIQNLSLRSIHKYCVSVSFRKVRKFLSFPKEKGFRLSCSTQILSLRSDYHHCVSKFSLDGYGKGFLFQKEPLPALIISSSPVVFSRRGDYNEVAVPRGA